MSDGAKEFEWFTYFLRVFLLWCHQHFTVLCTTILFTVNHLSLINDNFLWIGGHRELVIVPSASGFSYTFLFSHFTGLWTWTAWLFLPFTTEPHSFSSCLFRMCFQHCSSGTVHFLVQAFSFDARISLILSILYPGQETTSGAVLFHHCPGSFTHIFLFTIFSNLQLLKKCVPFLCLLFLSVDFSNYM